MRRFAILLASLFVVGLAHADEPGTGRFRLRVPEEAVRVAKLSGKACPTGRLALLSGGLFDLQTDGAVRHGKFHLDDGKLTLLTDDGTELHGEVRGEKVTLEGLAFEREVAANLTGLWTVHRNGFEEKGLKMDLRPDGKFKFSMAGATSEGSWSITEGKLVLIWSKIDGEDVDGLVKKEILIGDDGSFFQIDTYRYERASG